MSAIAEPPVTEPVKEQIAKEASVVAEPPKKEAAVKPVSIMDGLEIIREGFETKTLEQKPEVTEPKKEEVKPDAVVVDKAKEKPQMSESARSAFDKIESERNDFRQRFETTDKELKELRGKAATSEQATKQVEQLQAQVRSLGEQLKAASIERDPEFVDRFVKGKQSRMNELKSLAKAAGASDDEFQRAMQYSDDDKLSEWREGLRPGQRAAWDAHVAGIADLEFQKREAVENADKTFAELNEKRQKHYQVAAEEHTRKTLAMADQTVEKLFSTVEPIKEDSDLRSLITDSVRAAATEWEPEKILAHVGFALAQNKILGVQTEVIKGKDAEITKLTEELATLKQKVDEQNSFIESQSNGMPRSESFTSTKAPDGKPRSMLDDLRIEAPGVAVR